MSFPPGRLPPYIVTSPRNVSCSNVVPEWSDARGPAWDTEAVPTEHDSEIVDVTDAGRPTTGVAVLVVGTDDWAIEQAASSIASAGHTVLRCHEPGEPAFPCNGVRPDRVCPLDQGFGVVVTMRARPTPQPTQSEFGVTCAIRAGVPLVVGGITEGNPFKEWAQSVDPQINIRTAVALAQAVRSTEAVG